MQQINRRNFFKIIGIAGVGALSANAKEIPQNTQDSIKSPYKTASIIDVGLCDGCKDLGTPKCVQACQNKNLPNFPNPIAQIPYYFPRKIYEDYSKERDNISRLTPYNWTYIEHLPLENAPLGIKEVFIPRRCMHCDDPTCQKICPFGVISKDENGAVSIDDNFCFGGAKCRDVCPWGIPQRQAGVGIYLKIAPKLAGGGAMYKCDACADLLAKNQAPACESSCPKGAITFGERENIIKLAKERAKAYEEKAKLKGTYIYGDVQNGGTSTLYVSPLPFEMLSNTLNQKHNFTQEKPQKVGIPHLNLEIKNFVSGDSALIKSVLLAPVIGAIAGGIAVVKSNKGNKNAK
ncbi:4Fe-4S dicluster domain-containing protein [Helicobacter sp. MIT 11-5569]|uniref:4Fe-4S dicluster domain-containing protein n=1 Tax=Helicobacter sp. MIT 11-5569 TaxID=1548151 RepID=UPI00051FCFC7|nr:4Fe-4S dicluster domain-containing protein [Helicobacter sp. MIT 11-5569]TLD82651.1 4Fe-4S dicluster domain-containing protein [Helicobacter sp. MIT 11-5569]